MGGLVEAVQLLREVQSFVDTYGDASTQAVAREGLRRLQRDTFRVAVVGGFSRGKSTLLNALIGYELLPTYITPTTKQILHLHAASTLILLYRNERASRKERFSGLAEMRHRLEALCQIPDHYPEIHLFLPLPIPRYAILIDTPGLQEQSGTLTIQALPRFDAALFVLDAGVQTEGEIRFFQEVAAQFPVFCVFNRADTLTMKQENTEAVWQRFQQEILPLLSAPGNVFCPRPLFISAYLALRARQWQRDPELWEQLKTKDEKVAYWEATFPSPEALLAESGLLEFEKVFHQWLQAYPSWLALRALRLAHHSLREAKQKARARIEADLKRIDRELPPARKAAQRAKEELEDLVQAKKIFLKQVDDLLHAYQNRLLSHAEDRLRAFEQEAQALLSNQPATKLRKALFALFSAWPSTYWTPIQHEVVQAISETWRTIPQLDYTGLLGLGDLPPPAFTWEVPAEVLHPWPTPLSPAPDTLLGQALDALPEESDVPLLSGLINWAQDWLYEDDVSRVGIAFKVQMDTVRQKTLAFTTEIWSRWREHVLDELRREAGKEQLRRLTTRHEELERAYFALLQRRKDLENRQRALERQALMLEERLNRLSENAQAGTYRISVVTRLKLWFDFQDQRTWLVVVVVVLVILSVGWALATGVLVHP